MAAMFDVLISRIIATESAYKINGFQTEPKASASNPPAHSTASLQLRREM